MVRAVKHDLLYEAATSKSPLSGNGIGAELSIRGTAGPYIVIGSNFAPGTTAADIESAMLPVGGDMQSCRIMTAAPTVMAEMIFSDKENAQRVIDTFNNKKVKHNLLIDVADKCTDIPSRLMGVSSISTCIAARPVPNHKELHHKSGSLLLNPQDQPLTSLTAITL